MFWHLLLCKGHSQNFLPYSQGLQWNFRFEKLEHCNEFYIKKKFWWVLGSIFSMKRWSIVMNFTSRSINDLQDSNMHFGLGKSSANKFWWTTRFKHALWVRENQCPFFRSEMLIWEESERLPKKGNNDECIPKIFEIKDILFWTLGSIGLSAFHPQAL